MSHNDVHPDHSARVTNEDAGYTSNDVTHTTLQVISIGILICAVAWIIRPFVISIIWAAMIVVTTWPVLIALQTKLKIKRRSAAATMTAILLLVVFIPVSIALASIIQGANDAYLWVKSLPTFTVPPPPQWLRGLPFAGPKLSVLWGSIAQRGPEELAAYMVPYAQQALAWFVAEAGSIGMAVIEFFLAVIIAAILYVKGETASEGIVHFARRLAGQHGVDIVQLAAKAVRGVALGVVVTAIMQAAVGGIGLIVTGVPAAALLTAVMFMLCLAQIGPSLVLIPALIWLYWHDGALWGTVLLVFAVPTMTLDSFLRPVLIRKGADLPLIMIFAGVIGGLLAFGIIGLFIGPVVLAVVHTLLKAWVFGNSEEHTFAKKEDVLCQ